MSFAFLSRTFQESDLVMNFGVWGLWRRSHRCCEDSSERGKAGNHNVASCNLVGRFRGWCWLRAGIDRWLCSGLVDLGHHKRQWYRAVARHFCLLWLSLYSETHQRLKSIVLPRGHRCKLRGMRYGHLVNSLFILGCNPTDELCSGPFGRQLRLQLCQLLSQWFVATLRTVSFLQGNGLNQKDWFYIFAHFCFLLESFLQSRLLALWREARCH